jgi:quinol monooxygenase YgiN
MIAVTAEMSIQPGKEAEFEAAMSELVAAVRANEPGCKLYTLVRKEDTPGAYLVMELYDDAEAIAAHGASAHFKAAGPRLGACLAGPPKIARHPVVV